MDVVTVRMDGVTASLVTDSLVDRTVTIRGVKVSLVVENGVAHYAHEIPNRAQAVSLLERFPDLKEIALHGNVWMPIEQNVPQGK